MHYIENIDGFHAVEGVELVFVSEEKELISINLLISICFCSFLWVVVDEFCIWYLYALHHVFFK